MASVADAVPSLILVRRCEAAGQEPDAPLTEGGQRQAAELADFLSVFPIDAVLTSVYLSARQMAKHLAQLFHLRAEVDARLNERVLSPHSVRDWGEVVRDSFADPDLSAPGGGSANGVLQRAWHALNGPVADSSRLPVVVIHGNLLALVLHSIDPGFGYAGWENLTNPGVYRVRMDADGGMSFRRLWDPSGTR